MKSKVTALLWMLMIVAAFSPVNARDSAAQSKGLETWLPVTVCDLVKDSRYGGARVTFHATVLDGQLHGILLKDNRCDRGLRMMASKSVRRREDYNQFMRTVYSTRKLTGDHTIAADFYGKCVYRPAEPRLKWALDVERISNIEVHERQPDAGGQRRGAPKDTLRCFDSRSPR